MKKRLILAVLLIFTMLFCACEKEEQIMGENLLKNQSFEESTGTEVTGWILDRYDTSSPIEYYSAIEDSTAPQGKNVLKIESTTFNDARFVQEVEVVPDSYYCLTAYVKTDFIQAREADSGAHIGFLQTYCKSSYVKSNADWQKLTVYGKTDKDAETVKVALRLGDYSADASGTVYFDDVSLTRVESVPENISVQSMNSFSFAEPEQSDDTDKEKVDENKVIMDVTVIGLVLFVLLGLLLFWAYKRMNFSMRHLYIFLAVSFIVRIIASVMYVGFKVDIGCFSSWGSMMASKGIGEFYAEGVFCDYPPLYMIVLGIISSIGNLFKLNLQEGIGLALLKSPAMICDILSALMITKIAKKHIDEKIAVLLGIGYALLPTAIVNSAVWGQVDSILVLFMLITFLLIDNDKFGFSVITFTVGLLLKPQAILFGPVMLLAAVHEFYVIYLDYKANDKKSGSMRLIKGFGGLLISIGIFALLAIIMKNNQSDVTLDNGLTVNWLIGKYFETLGSYDYATLSSFGLMGLLDGQWIPSSTEVFEGITYGQLGTALLWLVGIGVIGIFAYLLYVAIDNNKRKKDENKIPSGWFWLLSALMVAGAVTVSTRTHERYMFPVIAMLIMSFVHFKDVRLLAISFGYALFNFINTAGLLFLYEEAGVYFANSNEASLNESIFKIGSFFIVALFIFQCYVTISIMLKKEAPKKYNKAPEKKQTVSAPQPKPQGDSDLQKLFKRKTYTLPKVTLKDIIICLLITVVYGCVAFTDLGDVKAAQNFWYADKSQVSATIDLGETKDFDSIKYLSASNSGIIKFYTSEDGESYSLYETLAVNGEDQWKEVGGEGRARYIKLETNGATSIKELVILKDEKPLPVKETSQNIVPVDSFSADAKNLFDDQECYNAPLQENAPATIWSSGGNYMLNFSELVSLNGAEAYFTEAGQFTVQVFSSVLGEDNGEEWTDMFSFVSDGEGWVTGTLLFADDYLSTIGSVLVKNENAQIGELRFSGASEITVDAIFDENGTFVESTNDVYNCFDEGYIVPGQSTMTKGKTWGVTSTADYVIADFGEIKNIDRGYYRTSLTKGSFGVYLSEDGVNWNRQNTLTVEESNLYYWHNISVSGTARYVLVTADTQYLKLIEIGFFENAASETTIPIKEIIAPNSKEDGGKNLFDEQDLVPPEGATYMNSMYFDEIYHARTAYESANGHSIYEWTHPPLGKDMMSWCVSLMGMTPFAWRFAGTVAGILMVPAMYFIGLLMFKKTSWATVTALLMAFDGMHYVQTRIATIDSFGVLFIILMFLFMFWYYNLSFYDVPLKKTFIPLGLCGLSFGLGAASKWICLYAGAGLAVIFFITIFRRWQEYSLALKSIRKATGEEKKYLNHIINSFSLNILYTLLFCIGAFIVIPLIIYCLSYYPYWNAESETRKWYEIILSNQEAMFSYHSKLEATHPYQSDWYTWPVMQTPMFYYAGPQDADNMSAIYAFGNPIVWYSGLIATLTGFGIAIMRFFNGRLVTSKGTLDASGFFGLFKAGDETDGDNEERDTRTLIFLIIGVACNLMPWMGINRCIFIYHYFATVPFIIFFTVYLLRYIARHNVRLGSILTVAIAVLTVFWFFMFRPIWTGTSVSRDFVGTWLHWQKGWFGYYFPKG